MTTADILMICIGALLVPGVVLLCKLMVIQRHLETFREIRELSEMATTVTAYITGNDPAKTRLLDQLALIRMLEYDVRYPGDEEALEEIAKLRNRVIMGHETTETVR